MLKLRVGGYHIHHSVHHVARTFASEFGKLAQLRFAEREPLCTAVLGYIVLIVLLKQRLHSFRVLLHPRKVFRKCSFSASHYARHLVYLVCHFLRSGSLIVWSGRHIRPLAETERCRLVSYNPSHSLVPFVGHACRPFHYVQSLAFHKAQRTSHLYAVALLKCAQFLYLGWSKVLPYRSAQINHLVQYLSERLTLDAVRGQLEIQRVLPIGNQR